MSTKEKILNAALRLFNDQGLAEVTLRQIAMEVGISQGNLNYHFKKRQDIIERLYFRLVEAMDQAFQDLQHQSLDLEMMYHINRVTMEEMYKYRFLLLDFVQVMRDNQTIKGHYAKVRQQRTDQFKRIIENLQANGLVRKEEFDQEFERLFVRMNIMGDFWLSFSEFADKLKPKELADKYAILFCECIYPYLTDVGKTKFVKLIE
ncbi:MAG: TetR/AcrR family transcriptional regulator [Bacteroidota bacterium]